MHVGTDSAIGANAVVTHDVPPDSIATGIPAVIRPAVTGSVSHWSIHLLHRPAMYI